MKIKSSIKISAIFAALLLFLTGQFTTKAENVITGGDTRINGVLALTSGNVSLNPGNLVLGQSATVAGTPSATLMIIQLS